MEIGMLGIYGDHLWGIWVSQLVSCFGVGAVQGKV